MHFLPHQLDDFAGSQAELSADGVKACSIFPGHLDDSVDFCHREHWLERLFHDNHHRMSVGSAGTGALRIFTDQLTKRLRHGSQKSKFAGKGLCTLFKTDCLA